MSAHLRDRKYSQKTPRGDGKNPANIAVLVIFLALGVFLWLPLFPPFGLVWCALLGSALYKELKSQGVIKTDVEGKKSVDWNKAKSAGQRSFVEVRAYSKDTAQRYKQHVSEFDRMEERQSYQHPHTPRNYSSDKCAQEKRLDQIKTLKNAGILDEKEYQVRKARILAGK